MSQPDWKLIYATDYSALYRDATGVYPPELRIAQTDDDVDEGDIEATAARVYRFPLDRCYRATRDDGSTVLVSLNPVRTDLPYPIESYVPWFRKHLGSIASSVGRSVDEIVDDLCSDDPARLASAYEDIGGYHGFDNFDSYPEEWSAHEFAEWPERGVRLSASEREAFTAGYIECALWCGVMAYKHDETCPCADDAPDSECTCSPEMCSSTDAGCDEMHASDLTDDARETLTKDAHSFYESNVADLRASGLDMARAGHDLWLTRNRHGAGYWDEKSRGKLADAALDRLTDAAHAEGEASLVYSEGEVSVL